MTTELQARCDALRRVGTDLLTTCHVEDTLAQSGAVHPCGSFFLGLALRPEIDFLLLVEGVPELAAAAVGSALRQRLGTDDVSILHRTVSDGSARRKHFVRARVMWPLDDALAATEQWTIDVAVWNCASWLALHGDPRPPQLDRPLTAAERALVLGWKSAAANGDRPKVDTRQFCELLQRGEVPEGGASR